MSTPVQSLQAFEVVEDTGTQHPPSAIANAAADQDDGGSHQLTLLVDCPEPLSQTIAAKQSEQGGLDYYADVSDYDGVDRMVDEFEGAIGVPEIRKFLRVMQRIRLPAGECKAIFAKMSKRMPKETRLTPDVIAALAKDERNRFPDVGVVSTPQEAATAVLAKLNQGGNLAVFEGGSLYYYAEDKGPSFATETGFFQRFSPTQVLDYAKREFPESSALDTKAKCDQFIDATRLQSESPGFFDAAPMGLNAANHFIKWIPEERRFGRFKIVQEHRARDRLPISYNPKAQAPFWNRHLRRVLNSEAKRQHLQEVFGAIIFRITPSEDAARRMVILLGGRNTGKSTTLRVLEMFVPANSITCVPPEEWGREYSRARLEGIRLNRVTELGLRLVAGDQLKQIVSCEMVSARHPYGRVFNFIPIAWHVFAGNELPRVSDRTDAFERRLSIVAFDRSLDRGEIEGDIFLRFQEEAEGILAWAKEGAERLATRGRFETVDGHLAAVTTMQFGNDPVEHLARLHVSASPGNRKGVTSEALRAALVVVAERLGVEANTGDGEMRRLATLMKSLHGAERHVSNGRPFWSYVSLVGLDEAAAAQAPLD